MDSSNTSNAQNYDARKARHTTKRKQEIESFQQKLLKTLEGPNKPAVVKKQEYVDVAFAAIAMKMKSTLSQAEIIDLVEDIQQIVNRACREKKKKKDGFNCTTATTTTTSNCIYKY